MYDNHAATERVRHPLAVLTEIEQRAVVEAEPPQEATTPSARLLTEYVQALGELVAGRSTPEEAEVYTFDEGHAGGCG
ncbi:hypothetical protein Stsp02_37560 [Streptomyces sp. NBRC 14336]|jgi:hypothetical protein|uniref:DUF6269 family protein n=1 Tax=Streptomyces sp. NBRC 14336 TaxID=3030992 RepID=UPI0024A0C318|nr:DUF6269 family protein [Streptomyces sp. NBRC 14336]WBO80836.1 hypothetical protein SBE_004648 [Streptomyces sp. SBE_14.2]GLW48094.1 hypothetical protein Stsp02_37560 [Streptomyces sp. NBRC 14336]